MALILLRSAILGRQLFARKALIKGATLDQIARKSQPALRINLNGRYLIGFFSNRRRSLGTARRRWQRQQWGRG